MRKEGKHGNRRYIGSYKFIKYTVLCEHLSKRPVQFCHSPSLSGSDIMQVHSPKKKVTGTSSASALNVRSLTSVFDHV
jgi:hypothetical protein